MSWADWLETIKNFESVDVTESAILTIDGTVCCAGTNFKISPEEFRALRDAIKSGDSSSGKMINGKKYLPVGRAVDGQCNFKAQKENLSVTIGSNYVVILKGKPDYVFETIATHAGTLRKNLHPDDDIRGGG